jgi:predicted RNase H-like HicB family nuclease
MKHPLKYPILLRDGEDGWIMAECPLFRGCISQGETRAEALANIREAIALTIEVYEESGWKIPELAATIELAEVEL